MTELRHRTLRPWRAVGASALALTLVACSGASDGTVSPTETGSVPPATSSTSVGELSAVGLSSDAVATLGRVELTNLDVSDAMGVELNLRTESGDVGVPLFIDGDTPYFIAPMFPADPMAGGMVELSVERDGERSPTLRLEVGPLPDAPGAWQEFVDGLADAIDRAAGERDSSFADLQAQTFESVPPALIGLKLAQAYVDDGSDHDLESVWTSDELDDDGRRLLDSLTAAMDLRSALDPADPLATVQGVRSALGATAALPTGFAPGPSRGRSLPASPSGSCIDPGIEIGGAEELSSLIDTAKSNTLSSDGPRRDVLDKIGTVTTVGGFIPAAGWVIAAGGAAFIALETYLNGTAGLYPSSLSNLVTEIDISRFPEDFTIAGSWFTVEVTARSTGWSADADVARTVLATMSAATSGLANVKVADGVALDTSLYLRDNAANGYVSDRAQSDGVLSFCPQTWTVDVTGEPWSRGKAVLDRFEVDSTTRTYRPIETGLNLPVDDTLRVEVDPSKFAGESAWQDHTITVKPILLSTETVIEVARPGDEADLTVGVTNATDPELSWESAEGGWRGDARLVEAGAIVDVPAIWERTHVTPTEASDYPYFITLEPTTSTGLRADGDPPRRAVVEVRLKELVIEPDPGTVIVNGSIQFVARNADGNVVDVTWGATGGAIDDGGVYTAGDRPGTYSVTAVSKDDPSITATATVIISEAECVVGTWRLRSQEFLDQIGGAFGNGGTIQFQGGEYITSFGPAGEFRGERRAWQFGISAEGQLIGVSITSVETGTWTLDPTGTLLQIDESSSDATVSMTLNGDPFPLGPQSFSSPAVGGTATFECERDVLNLTITADGVTVTAILDRID